MLRALIAAAALALGGCSAGSFFDLPAQPTDGADAPEAYYRQLIVTSGVPGELKKDDPSAQVMISGLRRSVAPQPGDWMTCLSASVRGRQRYRAVFLRKGEIIDSRSDVAIDRCAAEQYALLPAAPVLNQLGGTGGETRAAAPSGPRLPGLY